MLNLAWRNVFRNMRRSLITIASMGCGLAAIMFGQSMIKSEQAQLIEKATGTITGHIQVQHRSIKDLKFPDKNIEKPAPVERVLADHPRVKAYAKRIHLTGLVSSPAGSVGTLICGVEAGKEPDVTTMSTYLRQGVFLGGGLKGIVMGEKLAQKLDVRLGEKVVVMAQAADGSMGAEALRVVGLHHTGSATFDTQIVWIPLAAFQELLGVGEHVNQVVARIDDLEQVDRVKAELAEKLGNEPVQVLSWKDVDHEILAIQKFQNALLDVVLLVVFLIVALGILNTLLMSYFERVREFGVLMAIGARPRWVLRLVLAESLVLSSLGVAFGVTLGSLMIAYFGKAGLALPIGDALSYFIPFPSVIYMRFAWSGHLFAAGCVFVTSVLAAVPPALRACRLRPAEALRHV